MMDFYAPRGARHVDQVEAAKTGPHERWPLAELAGVSLRTATTHWRRLAAVGSVDGEPGQLVIRASRAGETTLDAVAVLRPVAG
jgi:hypothetical protein